MPTSQDLYVRLTDPSGRSKPIVSHHRVHDRERFIDSLKQTHEVKAKAGDLRNVEIVSEAEYRKFKGYKEYQQ
jgi:subtilisin-like proprotein convertase family protein